MLRFYQAFHKTLLRCSNGPHTLVRQESTLHTDLLKTRLRSSVRHRSSRERGRNEESAVLKGPALCLQFRALKSGPWQSWHDRWQGKVSCTYHSSYHRSRVQSWTIVPWLQPRENSENTTARRYKVAVRTIIIVLQPRENSENTTARRYKVAVRTITIVPTAM